MKLYSQNEHYKLYNGNMLDLLDVIDKESIDAVLTDPPYELNFMSKGWDNAGVSFQIDTWCKCYEVLKPGGYLLAFGGSRTFHRIACAIEDAGFEIRDTIMWLYGSGFPKSMNIGLAIDKKMGVESKVVGTQTVPDIRGDAFGTMNEKQGGSYKNITRDIKQAQNKWKGWGTALKPSFEPIIVARKPFKGSLVDNVIEYGVGGINIDECRVETNDNLNGGAYSKTTTKEKENASNIFLGNTGKEYQQPEGRFPANTILTYDETDYDEVCSGFPNTKSKGSNANYEKTNQDNSVHLYTNIKSGIHFEDSGSASRYFYCAKASKKDRDEGLDEFEEKPKTLTENKGRTFNDRCAICGKKFIGSPETICHCENPITDKTKSAMSKNTHPTVKPTELMQYLVRLVSPEGATILDPFNGSGSTGKAVMYENRERDKNYKYIGIELTEEYLPISKARIEYVCNLKEEKDPQMSIFDLEEMGGKNE